MVTLTVMPLFARLRATHPDKLIPWTAAAAFGLLIVATIGAVNLGVAADEAQAAMLDETACPR